MSTSTLRRPMSRFAYFGWVGLFIFVVLSMVIGIYLATRQIDYVWRWYAMPKYFVNHEEIEVKCLVQGEVATVEKKGEGVAITVNTPDGDETYTSPGAEDVRVEAGDTVYPGDTLVIYRKWQAGILLQGMWVTLKVSIYSIILGIVIGLVGGIARISDNPALKWSAITYVEIIRGSPLLVQIFIWYFVLATLINQLLMHWGMDEISALWYGVASLACFTGAYVTEIVRSGIQSIHKGQTEASRSLGMTYAQSMYHVILPQAMRRILPPLAGQFISLIKDSSLLGIIAVRELTKATREGITVSLQPYEFWFICAALYLILTFALSMFVQHLERRLAIK